jgi:hypothetical protein
LFNDDLSSPNYFIYDKSLASTFQTTTTPSGASPSISGTKINSTESGYIAAVGSLKADLSFYAAADMNQLPLKNIKIWWGDEQSRDPAYDSGNNNFYKNRKGSCSGPGDTKDNCDQAPFSFSHVYTCTPDSTTGTASQSYPEINVKRGDPICMFSPTLSVRDNWNVDSGLKWSQVNIVLSPN